MNRTAPLDQLQRWMLAVITHPEGVDIGMQSPAARQEFPISTDKVEQIITRSAACTSAERLAVYSHAYFARLLECLASEFEVLAKAAGAKAFAALCSGYLQACPSTSYTLGHLGAGLPDYLQQTRPPRTSAATQPDWADLLIDLARLERTYAEVFDGPGDESFPPIDVSLLGTIPAAEWSTLRLQTTSSLRLLSLVFPVHDYYSALQQSDTAAPPAARPVMLAISRRNYIVQFRELTPPQATLLAAIQGDQPFGAALSQTMVLHGIEPDELQPQLAGWFRDWTATGLIRGVSR